MALYDVSDSAKKASPELVAGGTLYAANPVGTILPYGGTNIPTGWGLCDGSAVSRTIYTELFAVIGTAFGSGDGSTTFNLPDLRGEFLRGAGTNSHSGQGNGGAVGEHQDASEILNYYANASGSIDFSGGDNYNVKNSDNTKRPAQSNTVVSGTAGTGNVTWNSVRPTNTSVNYIICMKRTAVPADFITKVDEAVEDVYGDVIPSDASASNQLVSKSNVPYTNQTIINVANVNLFGASLQAYGAKSLAGKASINGQWYDYISSIQGNTESGGSWVGNAILWGNNGDFYTLRKGYSTSTTWVISKHVKESDLTPSGTQPTTHKNYTNISTDTLFDESGILTKTPTELINALKNKGYINRTNYNQLHCVINFVNSNASNVIISDGTHSINLVNGWIEFEGAFLSETSTFSSEERWIMKLYNVSSCQMAIVTKRAGANLEPIMKSVTLT